MDKVIYKGGGYFHGLPARDMTADEWAQFDKQLTRAALQAGLYQVVKVKEVKPNEQ